MEILNPSGATEVTRLHAERLGTLSARKVALLSDDMWQAHRMLPLVKDALEARHPDIEIIPESELPMGNALIDREDTADLLAARGVDAVIVGNAA